MEAMEALVSQVGIEVLVIVYAIWRCYLQRVIALVWVLSNPALGGKVSFFSRWTSAVLGKTVAIGDGSIPAKVAEGTATGRVIGHVKNADLRDVEIHLIDRDGFSNGEIIYTDLVDFRKGRKWTVPAQTDV